MYLNDLTDAVRVGSSHCEDVSLSRVIESVLSLLRLAVHSEVVVNLDLGYLVLALLEGRTGKVS